MLFNETKISGINVKNRIIRSATHDGLANENGAPSDKLIAKYEHLAKNEIGCIITGYAAVSRNGVSPYPGMMKIYNDDVIDKYNDVKYKEIDGAICINGASREMYCEVISG